MAGNVEPADYMAAQADPLAPFAAAVMKHMNEDHAEDIAGYVRHYVDVPCTEAMMVALDRFGITVCTFSSQCRDILVQCLYSYNTNTLCFCT